MYVSPPSTRGGGQTAVRPTRISLLRTALCSVFVFVCVYAWLGVEEVSEVSEVGEVDDERGQDEGEEVAEEVLVGQELAEAVIRGHRFLPRAAICDHID